MKQAFQAALFDLDGTLFDTEGQYSIFWGSMARKYRPDVPDLEYQIKGTTLKQIFERFFPDPDTQRTITEQLNSWEQQMHYEWIPGALDFLRDIKQQGVRCAVVTSSNLRKMQSVAQQMPEFASLFDRILTSEDFSASKPSPDCYLLGARVLEVPLEHCIVFEDAFTGLQAGMSAGIYTIGLATYNTPEQIRDKCHHVVKDFRELDYDKAERLLRKG